MENKNNENIVKDLLYDKSTRDMLQSQATNAVVRPIHWIRSIAAIIVLLILSLTAYHFLSGSDDLYNQARSAYQMPSLTKSRSADVNIIDGHLEDFNSGNYTKVLSYLQQDSLSEKDKLSKAQMYFQLGSLKEAAALLDQAKWVDAYNEKEANWLRYLIAFSQNDNARDLERYKEKLDGAYILKAEKLMAK